MQAVCRLVSLDLFEGIDRHHEYRCTADLHLDREGGKEIAGLRCRYGRSQVATALTARLADDPNRVGHLRVFDS
jgi:hypothetical protein